MRAKAMLMLATIVTSVLGIDGAPAVAQDAASKRLCAARDVKVVMLIEDHGAANDIEPEKLAKAFSFRWTRASRAPTATWRMG